MKVRIGIVLAALLILSGCSSLWPGAKIEDCSPNSTPICIRISKSMTPDQFENMLIRHEGYRRTPYEDNGNLSVGYGRNLTTNGISEAEALELMRNDVAKIAGELAERRPVVNEVNSARYYALVSMAYTMGVNKLDGFILMWNALEKRHYDEAATQVLLSKWCSDVGIDRCREISRLIGDGKYQEV